MRGLEVCIQIEKIKIDGGILERGIWDENEKMN